jgi:hypothetical protein
MTVKELMDRLSVLDLTLPVYAFDADSEAIEEVSGLLVSPDSVEIQTDDPR